MHSPIKRNVLQHNINKKLKPGLVTSYNIRPGSGGPIPVSALHKFVTYLLRHLLTAPGPTRGDGKIISEM